MIKKLTKTKATMDKHLCGFHMKHPGVPYAGCTCSSKYVSVEDTDNDPIKEKIALLKSNFSNEGHQLRSALQMARGQLTSADLIELLSEISMQLNEHIHKQFWRIDEDDK